MVEDLDDAVHQSMDPPEGPPLVVAYRRRTGRRGRPRMEIDPTFLTEALSLRGPTLLGQTLHCHGRTVRRRALELNIVEPGATVYVSQENEHGTTIRTYTSSTPAVSNLTNNELDEEVADILEIFPTFGRRLLRGHLLATGHRVPSGRITASYARVHGSPARFGDRRIGRREYRVPGPNSLAHHDGQHGTSNITSAWYHLTQYF